MKVLYTVSYTGSNCFIRVLYNILIVFHNWDYACLFINILV